MPECLLVYDVLTSGTKTCVFSAQGELLAEARAPLTMRFDGLRAEQSPAQWWETVVSTTRQVLQTVDPREIAAVTFSTQSQLCLCVDANGTPLHDAMTWSDARAAELPDPLAARFSGEEFYRLTGLCNQPVAGIRKLYWIKEQQPELYAKTHRMLQCKDYLALRMTGRFVTDFTEASSTFALDLGGRRWAAPVLDALGIDPAKLPDIVESNTVLGPLIAEAAAATGLREGTPVVMGAGDVPCSAIGAGCVEPGQAYLSLGSGSTIWTAHCREEMLEDGYPNVVNNPHAVPGKVLSFIPTQETAITFKWLEQQLLWTGRLAGQPVRPNENAYCYDYLESMLTLSPPGANGLRFRPGLQNGQGGLDGLRWTHTREDIVRAAMEGSLFAMREHLLRLGAGKVDRLVVTGAASRERAWMQMIADVYGIPTVSLDLDGTPDAIGGAVLAGQAVGLYGDFAQAGCFRRERERFEPAPAAAAHYREQFEEFHR